MAKQKNIIKPVLSIIVLCVLVGVWYVYSGIYRAEAQPGAESLTFEVQEGDNASTLASRLEEKNIIRNKTLFEWYVRFKKVDTKIHRGTFTVYQPVTIAHIAQKLQDPSLDEVTITIIPGWNVRDIAAELEENGVATKEEVYALVGEPAVDYRARADKPTLQVNAAILRDKPDYVSFEGYFRPDTYRFFKDATAEEILSRFVQERNRQLAQSIIELKGKEDRSLHDVMTMASILEKEVRSHEDKKMVADIFWKRHDVGMGLQADSTVHYVSGRGGDVFTTNAERDSENIWNTYKYPGLPPGPISTPGLESIDAAANPTPNDYWYFITELDTGKVHYAKTLEEHNANIQKYLR